MPRDGEKIPNALAAEPTTTWLSSFDGVFSAVGPVDPGEAADFRIWPGDKTIASTSCCKTATLLRLPRPVNGRLLDHLALTFVLSGMMKIGEGPGQTTARAGDGLFIDLSQPVRLEYAGKDDPTIELTLWVPRRFLSSELTVLETANGVGFRSGGPATSVLNAAARALHAELDRLSAQELDHLVAGIFGLAARVLITCDNPASTRPELESFATICRFIEMNLAARDLGVERLASTFGLSRASLYRLFEPVGGVASYVRTRRLNRARQELLTAGLENRRIGPIAYQSGFRSVTAFNRAFRQAYGHTPSEARHDRLGGIWSAATTMNEFGILGRALLALEP